MKPVLTPQEMTAVDQAAPEPVDVLIERAARAVSTAALRLLGGGHGRRVHVIAGPGNNGADGRVAAHKLQQRGVHVSVSAPSDPIPTSLLQRVDMIIDAAFGTGFRGEYTAPVDWNDEWVHIAFGLNREARLQIHPTRPQVLAVDIPSGVDGLTGASGPHILPADHTVTFAALKPGLLYGPGAELAGRVEIVDIGIDVSPQRSSRHVADPLTWWMEQSDLTAALHPRPLSTHKWRAAVWVIGGSHGMGGAPSLTSNAAARSGAGYVRVSTPGVEAQHVAPYAFAEVVRTLLGTSDWAQVVIDEAERFHALAIGPGLGRDATHLHQLGKILQSVKSPIVLDGDGLGLWENHRSDLLSRCKARHAKGKVTVLTPHDGEFRALTGSMPGVDRLATTRQLAAETGAIVVLKGPATTIATPEGEAFISTAGDQRLATAGTGDVLTGIIASQLARHSNDDVEAQHIGRVVACAVEMHGITAGLCSPFGFVASDIVKALPQLSNAIL